MLLIPGGAAEPVDSGSRGNAERRKARKTKPGFPPFPPLLEIALRFPHSHRYGDDYIYRRLHIYMLKPKTRAFNGMESIQLWFGKGSLRDLNIDQRPDST